MPVTELELQIRNTTSAPLSILISKAAAFLSAVSGSQLESAPQPANADSITLTYGAARITVTFNSSERSLAEGEWPHKQTEVITLEEK